MQDRQEHSKRKGSEGRRTRPLLLVGILAAAALGAAAGDTLYVTRLSLPLRSGKFAFDKVLGTATQGDSLTVNGIEGKYLKVTFTPKDQPPVQGYVLETALSTEKPEVATTRTATDKNTLATVAASKGELDSKKFASAKNLSPAAFEAMVAESEAVMKDGDKTFDDFMKAGKVGTYKPQPANPQ